jgi:hypothetical protein
MPESIKVYRTAAFAPLAQEIKRFGALSKAEALTLFDPALVASAKLRKVYAERETSIGPVLYLLHQGRKLAGMAGAFTPTDDSLMNAVCLRQIALQLEEAGQTVDLTARKRSIVYQNEGQTILVLAQHQGYAFAALRRLYKAFVETNEFSEVHVYTYMTLTEREKLSQTLYEPARASTPLDRNRLRLFSLPFPAAVWGDH